MDDDQLFYDYIMEIRGTLGGWWFMFSRGPEGWKATPEYKSWIAAGKPTGKPTESPSQLWATYQGIFPVSKFAEEPDFGPDGFHWEQTDWNEAIGAPLDEMSWMLVSDDEVTVGEIMSGELEIWEADGIKIAMAVFRDADGNISVFDSQYLFEVPTEGLSPAQEAQSNYWIDTVGLGYAQLHAANERHAAEMGLSGRELAEMARQFDEEMGLSRDKFEEEKLQFMEEIGFSKEQLAWEKEAFAIRLAWEQEQFGEEQAFAREQLAWMKESEAARLALEEKKYGAALTAAPGKWVEAYAFQEGGVPPAPSWLPQFAPGTGAGAPITPQGLKTVAAPTLQKMPWGQQQMLGGYAEYANVPGSPQNLQEIQQRTMQTLPQERTKQARWQPVQQV